ncbi:hypothetical protein Fmac_001401 [Flemingia macrophylla]|uniref:Dual specificity phosphatase catalytic domain-containing protein n=1 Tax=Flemingia macrophylla TaxID=520843 RepID=A0ABD1NHG7_9FABA
MHPSISLLTQPCPLAAAAKTTVPPSVLVPSFLLADSPPLHSKRKILVPTLVAPLLTKPSHATTAPAPPISLAPSPPKSPSDCSFGVAPPLIPVLSCYSGCASPLVLLRFWSSSRLPPIVVFWLCPLSLLVGVRVRDVQEEEVEVVGVRDFDAFDLRMWLAVVVSKLYKAINSNGGVTYIHCTAGLERAPAVALAYMFWVLGYKLNEANATSDFTLALSSELESVLRRDSMSTSTLSSDDPDLTKDGQLIIKEFLEACPDEDH